MCRAIPFEPHPKILFECFGFNWHESVAFFLLAVDSFLPNSLDYCEKRICNGSIQEVLRTVKYLSLLHQPLGVHGEIFSCAPSRPSVKTVWIYNFSWIHGGSDWLIGRCEFPGVAWMNNNANNGRAMDQTIGQCSSVPADTNWYRCLPMLCDIGLDLFKGNIAIYWQIHRLIWMYKQQLKWLNHHEVTPWWE